MVYLAALKVIYSEESNCVYVSFGKTCVESKCNLCDQFKKHLDVQILPNKHGSNIN